MKAYLKQLLFALGLAGALNGLLFRLAVLRNYRRNRRFRVTNPSVIIPPDYFLYETYQLDYQQFLEDGLLTAQEIGQWTAGYVTSPPEHILDWGCGAGRVTRHMPLVYPSAVVYGCDSNAAMIRWNQQQYPGIRFSHTGYTPPLPFAACFFNMVYGLSVLTHIGMEEQQYWIKELHRVIADQGLLLLTTHGAYYEQQLTASQQKQLHGQGLITQSYPFKGHRMMSTYHKAWKFRELLGQYFTVLEYHDGGADPGRIGGQDLWILRKQSL